MQNQTILLSNRYRLPIFKLNSGTSNLVGVVSISVMNDTFKGLRRRESQFAFGWHGVGEVDEGVVRAGGEAEEALALERT